MQILSLTIRQRLPLYISVSALVILLLEGFFIYEFAAFYSEREFKSRIQKRLEEADSLISLDREHPFAAINALPPGSLPDEKILYANHAKDIELPNGKKLLFDVVDTAQLDHCTFCFARIEQRDYGIRHDSTTHHTLVISAIDRYGQSKIENLKSGIVIGILIGVLFLTFISWYWVKKMLQPIADKINKARNIGAKSLNLRLDVKNNHDELGELALTFNEMLERIEQGFRVQQQFIRNASHEMRTPLTAIIVEADLALHQNRSNEHYQEALRVVRERAEKLNDLVGQLLIMARVETSKHQTDETIAADEALLSAFKILQSKYPQAKHQIKLILDASDPAQLLLRCDPAILQAAYLNLLDNALKYGNGESIGVRLFPKDQNICLEVSDHGNGISPDEIEDLFKPFYRSKQNQHLPGSGIGLSLVKSIAEKYGGSIRLDSVIGKGTKATFSLPAAV